MPGDNQVTILWSPTCPETEGDAYFTIANDPDPARYDPSYRKFDVEGYRIYRGRTDSPNELELVAQFDYDTTQIYDFRGAFNQGRPALLSWAFTACCAGPFPVTPPATGPLPGLGRVQLTGQIKQVRSPCRAGSPWPTGRCGCAGCRDTLVTGGNTGFPALANTGVPFAFTDDGSGLVQAPRNNVRYFYAVTAFDVNSFQSGPSSLESQRLAERSPVQPASNAEASSTITPGFFGRRRSR